MLKTLTLLTLLAGIAAAQSPSGLLTGPVTYTGTLTQNPYGDTKIWTKADGSMCGVETTPSCYIVHYVSGYAYKLSASDGTGDCYSWNTWQMGLGPCQSSFHGAGAGENSASLYCEQASMQSSDANGTYNLTCVANFDGTAPETTLFNINVTITHHPVSVWIGPYFRTPRHLETWQQIDAVSVVVSPIPGS